MKKKINCVLIVDDDEPTNILTRLIIEETGYADHIEVAQSGEEALDYLIKSENAEDGSAFPSPDLIFLDINMPAMDGWEFLDEYKKLTIAGKVIVVMLTTSLFPKDKIRAKDMPEISGFENKPLTAENFEKIFTKHFSSSPTL